MDTHGKGERVKIPFLPNRIGKRSGTMTMVTTDFDLFYLLYDSKGKLETRVKW